MLGTGLGQGHSVLIGFAAKSDFILATAGEELGLAGLTAILLLYGLLVERGFRTGLAAARPLRPAARRSASPRSSPSRCSSIAGGVMGLIPLTGMAMPFLAQGGSSVVTNWVIVGDADPDQRHRAPPAPAPPRPDAEMTQVVRP